ncbi:MAG: 50S ribosomal protein L9 [Chloroflexota bacterium]
MKVLFLQDVKGTARAGEVKEVSSGFARNYLLPKRLAVVATGGELKKTGNQKVIEKAKQERAKREADVLAERLATVTVNFKVRVGEQHRLYGSITSADIAEAIEKAAGQPINKRKIILEEPLRHLGTYQVPVKIAADLEPTVTVVVEAE